VSGTSPVARQRELGTRLRALRNARGMTVEEVAAELLCSTTKISRLETAARRPSLRDVRDLCVLYEIDEQASRELMSLAREAREPGWWTEYPDLNLDPLIGLEQEASAITSYAMNFIPPLLQTEEYAETIIKATIPKIDPDIHRQRVEALMRRQQLLEPDERPRYRALLDESVLHRRVGSTQIMAAQLEKLLRAERKSKATIQVVPFDLVTHAAQDSNFMLLEFDEEPNLSPLIFVEGLTGNQYLERPADIARYRETLDDLRDSALSPRDSIQRVDHFWNVYVSEAQLSHTKE
jgi:transcriptional regulator with XRE-family HTH domain